MAPKRQCDGRVLAQLADDPAELARALDELQESLSTDGQSPEEAWDRLRSRYDNPEPPPWIDRLRQAAAGDHDDPG